MNSKKLLMAAACAAAAIVGYFAASVSTPDAGKPSPAARGHHRRIDAADKSTLSARYVERSDKQLAALKEDLRGRFSSSPSAEEDFALLESARAVLSTMSAAQLGDFAQDLSTPATQNPPTWKTALLREISRQWGLLDPPAASLGQVDGHAVGIPSVAFNDWLERDPAAVVAWLDSGSFPPGNEGTISRYRITFIDHLATTDFPAAREAMMKLKSKEQELVLFGWSNIFPHDPEKRMEVMDLLKNLTNPEWVWECRENLVTGLARKSPEEAFAFVKASALPEAEHRVMEDSILGVWARKDLDAAFAHWSERNESAVPAPLLDAVSEWGTNPPGTDNAVHWVMTRERGPVREQFQRRLIGSLTSDQRFRQAAEMSSYLENREERERLVKTVLRQWEERDKTAANEWRAGHLADERVTETWKPAGGKPD